MRDFSSDSHPPARLGPDGVGMMDRIAQLVDGGRGIAVGSVIAVAAIGMAVTVALAGALGDEGPEVQPIVINTSTGGHNTEGTSASDDADDDTGPRPTGSPSRREPGDGGTDTRSGPSAGSGSSTATDTASDATPTGPVPTAPPPPPVTAAPPVGGGGDEPDEPEADTDSDESDESDGGDSGEDD